MKLEFTPLFLNNYTDASLWQSTVLTLPQLESRILKVDRSYRITLPQVFARLAGWIAGENAQTAWLFAASPDRCRLLGPAEADQDEGVQALRARIDSSLARPESPLELNDTSSVALGLRLLPVEIRPRKPRYDWRLALPEPIAAVMEIRPGESKIAAIFVGGHIELWTIKLLASAMEVPISEII